jgi:cytochrome c oxidase cbb3-type subunit III
MQLRVGRFFTTAVVFGALIVATTVCARAQIQQLPVDEAAANRGQQLFASTCGQCHGADARGAAKGPDLIRSLPVLHDRMQQLHGSDFIPLLQKPNHTFNLTQAQVADISQFLTRAINRTLRSGGYYNQPSDLLSGDAKAGEAYFNGAGGCNTCHSVTGDLAGIASKFPPATLQQRIVFPQTGGFGGRGRGAAAAPPDPRTRTQVTVTPSHGSAVTGTLVRIDDFDVTLQDSTGAYRTFARTPDTKVDVNDPYAAHVALLDKYTDADIHNLTAYLETLK